MKTLHFTNSWHERSGGIRTFYLQLMRHAPAHNHEMCMVVPAAQDGIEEINSHARVRYLRSWHAPFNRAYRMLAPHGYLAPRSPIARILNEESPDLVEICDKYSLPYLGGLIRIGLLPGYRARPTVTALSCERLDENIAAYLGLGPSASALAPHLLRWLYFPLADHHIAVSRHTAGELHEVSNGHKVTRGLWLGPMGVDLDTFSPSLRTRPYAAGGELNLLYAGRLVPEKNTQLLLDTMARLGDTISARLLIAGDGILRPQLQRAAATLAPGRVVFLGHITSRQELARLIANADAFLHPNPREPFGIAPLEAMASGAPLVAPTTGGVTTYAHPGNAWLSEPTGDAFASAIRSIFFEPEDRQRRVAEALLTASRFGWPEAAAHFFRLYAALHAIRLGSSPEHFPPALFYSTTHRSCFDPSGLASSGLYNKFTGK
ncbi:MAG: glycosyltransferase [Bryobacterales bacterium]|nr:glycosyltransferase [Bryobacterales bacterium]